VKYLYALMFLAAAACDLDGCSGCGDRPETDAGIVVDSGLDEDSGSEDAGSDEDSGS
jgi:hypothetical protein